MCGVWCVVVAFHNDSLKAERKARKKAAAAEAKAAEEAAKQQADAARLAKFSTDYSRFDSLVLDDSEDDSSLSPSKGRGAVFADEQAPADLARERQQQQQQANGQPLSKTQKKKAKQKAKKKAAAEAAAAAAEAEQRLHDPIPEEEAGYDDDDGRRDAVRMRVMTLLPGCFFWHETFHPRLSDC